MEDDKILPEEIDAVVQYLKVHYPENTSRKYALRLLQSTLPALRQLAMENPEYTKDICEISIKYDREVGQPKYFEIQDIPFLKTVQDDEFGWSAAILTVAVVVSCITWPSTWTTIQVLLFMAWSAVIFMLVLLARINQRTRLFPDSILFKLLLPIVFIHTALKTTLSIDALWSSLFGMVILFVLSWLVFAASSGRFLGFGSVKLLAIVGLLVGLNGSILVLLITFVGSIAFIVFARKRGLPIGWVIASATIISYVSSYLLP